MFSKTFRLLLFILSSGLIETCVVPEPGSHLAEVPYERRNFLDLLANNPNYFGNAPDSGDKPVNTLAFDTSYEELRCIGYNPDLGLLSATIEIKLPFGFGGDLCSNGSLEYVRFWVSYAGGPWSNIG